MAPTASTTRLPPANSGHEVLSGPSAGSYDVSKQSPMPLTDLDMIARFATALVCGGAIGLEREWRKMSAGYRTLALVCLGSCIAVVAAVKGGGPDEFSRVAQGIVTGIGFLGAGVIIQHSSPRDVKGLTTAATIWLTAAIGLLAGLGELRLAAVATFMALCVLLSDYVVALIGLPKPDTGPKKSQTSDDATHGDSG